MAASVQFYDMSLGLPVPNLKYPYTTIESTGGYRTTAGAYKQHILISVDLRLWIMPAYYDIQRHPEYLFDSPMGSALMY